MGRMKEHLFDLDNAPESHRISERDYKIAESAKILQETIEMLVVDSSVKREFLLDDMRTEILYLNDIIRRH